MGGFFNAILRDKEKEDGSDKGVSEVMKFQDALNICSLCDLG